MARKKTPGSIERRGDSYRVRLCVAGERHYVTVRTDELAVAQDVARKRLAELERDHTRRQAGLPTGVRCSDLFDRFVRDEVPTLARGTRDAYADTLKPVRAFFRDELGDPLVERVRAADITRYLTWRRVNRQGEAREGAPATPVSNRTLQKDRAVLHRIFAYADRLELRDGNPVARTDPPKADGRDPVLLNPEQYEALLAACDTTKSKAGEIAATPRPMLRLYVLVLGEAGLRCESEALRLTWDDVDLERGFLWVASGRADGAGERHRTKSGKGRWVPLTPRLKDALRAHAAAYRLAGYGRKGERSPWLFHHEVTHGKRKAGARIGSLRAAFTAAAALADLPEGLHQHDLRHRRVTTWLADGQNPVHVKEAMGHSDLRTTMGYTHLAREHLAALVAEPAAPAKAVKRAVKP